MGKLLLISAAVLSVLGICWYFAKDNTSAQDSQPVDPIPPAPQQVSVSPESDSLNLSDNQQSIEESTVVAPKVKDREEVPEPSAPTPYADQAPTQVSIPFVFSVPQGDFSVAPSEIHATLFTGGEPFSAPFKSLSSASIGSSVVIELGGLQWPGILEKRELSRLTENTYMKIDFGSPGQFMSVYTNGDKVSGKIYTAQESYVYEFYQDVGYMMTLYEFRKANDALYGD